ncbi:MAG: Txe/YoeB family addiction module toxin [Campylobacterales bacterium]|nr:Txe/YoeB family addiction module toxin [Campylobacterales bacterium]
MRLIWSQSAWEEYLSWQNDKQMLKRINTLIQATMRSPFEGIGKPEPLRHQLSGYWSRRINDEHRLVYTLDDDALLIVSCRFHY